MHFRPWIPDGVFALQKLSVQINGWLIICFVQECIDADRVSDLLGTGKSPIPSPNIQQMLSQLSAKNSEVLCGLASKTIVLACLGVWYFDVLAWCWAVLCWLSLDWLLWVSPVHLSFWTPTSNLGNACGFLYFRRFKQWNMFFLFIFAFHASSFFYWMFHKLMILLLFLALDWTKTVFLTLVTYCLFWAYLQFPYLSNIQSESFFGTGDAFLVTSTLRTPLWTRIVHHPWILTQSYRPDVISTFQHISTSRGLSFVVICRMSTPLQGHQRCPRRQRRAAPVGLRRWFCCFVHVVFFHKPGVISHESLQVEKCIQLKTWDWSWRCQGLISDYVMASSQKLWFWSCQLRGWV